MRGIGVSRVAKGGIVKLPAPVMGVDWSVSYDEVQAPYAPCSLDWIADGYSVSIRDRHKVYPASGIFYNPYHMASYEAANQIIFSAAASGGGVNRVDRLDVGTGVVSNVSGSGYVWGGSVTYQNVLFCAGATSAYGYTGGAAFPTVGVGFSGASGGTILPGCFVYRDRYCQIQAQTLFFAPTAGATSGALSSFNLASYYARGEFVGGAAITITDSNNLADYMILVSSGGDVLAFTGDFPGSANWQMVVRTRLPAEFSSALVSAVGITPYGGDAYIFVERPATLLSAKKLIQEGRVSAEAQSPLARHLNFIRRTNGTIRTVTAFLAKNALIVEGSWDTPFKDLIFGITAPTQASNYLYVDLLSGAVSPFSGDNYRRSVNGAPFYNKIITHSDGYVYQACEIAGADDCIVKLFGETYGSTVETYSGTAVNTFLAYPYSDLGVPDSTKTMEIAYATTARDGGYVEAKLAAEYDFDPDVVQTFESNAGTSSTGLLTKRLTIPVGGQANQVSFAFVNQLRSGVSSKNISIQFEDGGPY
jgi:hypothetical protein